MPVRIVTIPFNHEKAVFEDEDLCRFLLNKQVKSLTPKFFQVNADAYWTVFIEYEPLVKETEQPQEQNLSDSHKSLLHRLKQWRAEKAQKEGVRVFSWNYNPRRAGAADRDRHSPGGTRRNLGFRLCASRFR